MTQRVKNIKNATAREILAFSMFPLGLFFINSTVYTVFNFYMTDVVSLNMALVSIVLLGTKAWDAINDPMMGAIVERTRSKMGKCRPYLLWMSIPLALTTAFLFLPVEFPDKFNLYNSRGELMGNGGNFVLVLLMYMLYIMFFTAVEIPYNSMTPLVFPEKNVRVKAISISNTVGSMGSILPTVLIWTMIGFLGNGMKDRTDWGYFWSALIFAVIGAAVMMYSVFGVKEKIYIPPHKMNARKSIKTIITDRRMLVLIISAFFAGGVNVGSMFLPYFARWNCIGILPMDRINAFFESMTGKDPNLDAVSILPTILSIMSGISYMLSMLIIPPLLKKMSKKDLWIWMSLTGAAANILTYVIGVYLIPYNTLPGFIVYCFLRFFTNFPVGMSIVLIIAMFADISDAMELKTGERLEATAYSLKGLMFKMSIAVFDVIMLLIIDVMGYNADRMEALTSGVTVPLIDSTTAPSILEGINYTSLLNGIFFMLTAASGIILLLQAVPMLFLKFDEEEIEKSLIAYREKKQAEMDKELAEALSAKE